MSILLFVVCINDLEGNVCGLITKFADDVKISGRVEIRWARLKQDIDQQEKWGREELMEFNCDKCKVKHFNVKPVQNIPSEWEGHGQCCRTERLWGTST